MSAPASDTQQLPEREALREIGLQAGLAAVGFATADPFVEARETLEARKAAGLHGGMQFTFRNPKRSTTPEQALAGAKTLIAAAFRYDAASRDDAAPSQVGHSEPLARIAAYAWRDHYRDLRDGLDVVGHQIRASGHKAIVLADDNALVDRSAAVRAGLGWFGKNSNVLLPGQGSWFVLGAVLTTAEYAPDVPVEPGCGGCTRCLDGCPTGAIVAEGVVDARRCLAWLLQAKDFPAEFRTALGDRIYGCDDCQEVCPPNRVSIRRPSATSADANAVRDTSVEWLLTASDDDLFDKHGRWYIPDREARFLRRNALIVLGNVPGEATASIQSLVERYLADDDPMLRAHAVWAAKRLGLNHLLNDLVSDASPEVQAELGRDVTQST